LRGRSIDRRRWSSCFGRVFRRRRQGGRFGQNAVEAFKLSRSRLLEAIRALRWILWQFGADRVGEAGRLDARFQSGYALTGGLRMSGTAGET
jgi:hypothetical protein